MTLGTGMGGRKAAPAGVAASQRTSQVGSLYAETPLVAITQGTVTSSEMRWFLQDRSRCPTLHLHEARIMLQLH